MIEGIANAYFFVVERLGHNLGTVAVIPGSNAVPLQNFTFELGLALNDIGRVYISEKCLVLGLFLTFQKNLLRIVHV